MCRPMAPSAVYVGGVPCVLDVLQAGCVRVAAQTAVPNNSEKFYHRHVEFVQRA